MRARLLPLVDESHRDFAQPLRRRRVILEQLAEPNRARKPCGAAPDDQNTDLDALARRVGRSGDDLGGRKRRRVVRGANRTRHQTCLLALSGPHELGELRGD